MKYRALLIEYRALLIEYRALLIEYRALLIECICSWLNIGLYVMYFFVLDTVWGSFSGILSSFDWPYNCSYRIQSSFDTLHMYLIEYRALHIFLLCFWQNMGIFWQHLSSFDWRPKSAGRIQGSCYRIESLFHVIFHDMLWNKVLIPQRRSMFCLWNKVMVPQTCSVCGVNTLFHRTYSVCGIKSLFHRYVLSVE